MIEGDITLQKRFEDKYLPVTESGCWLWLANVDEDGYGKIKVHSQQARAHRVSYELHVGLIPPGLFVLHSCDTPACVNPSHLFLGTNTDNMRDRENKKRGNHAVGETHGSARLMPDAVLTIRARLALGETQQAIADDYGLARQTVGNIKTRKIWRHI